MHVINVCSAIMPLPANRPPEACSTEIVRARLWLCACLWIRSTFRLYPGFPLYFGSEIQGLFKDPEGAFSMTNSRRKFTYSMDSITAIFNICFRDYETVLVDKNQK